MTDEDPTTTDVIAEMAKQHPLYGAADRPDLRRLAKLTEQVSIDATCENTGATPLLWAIENDSPLFSFLLVRQPDVTKRGKGEYDITPIDLAMSKGLIEKAETLARWGAPCPPAIQEQWDAEKRGREKYDQEIKKTERMLEKGLKAASFTEETKRLEARLGVSAKNLRGRRGHLSYKDVPVRKLAKGEAISEDQWLATLHRKLLAKGVSLYSTTPTDDKAKLEICITPTTEKRHVVTISKLLSSHGALPYERMEKADFLDVLAKEYPFDLVTCGPLGVVGALHSVPDDLSKFAEFLFSNCAELVTDYEIRFDSEQGNNSIEPANVNRDLIPLLTGDIAKDGMFWLPWGVDH